MTTTTANTRPRVVALLMLLIVTAGLALRVWNINFDQGLGTHPDERSTACNYAPSIKLPASWEEFTDPQQSPLNPLWDRNSQQRRGFTYGHFPLYLGVVMGETLHRLAPFADQLGSSGAANHKGSIKCWPASRGCRTWPRTWCGRFSMCGTGGSSPARARARARLLTSEQTV